MKKRIWTCLGVVGAVALAVAGAFLATPEEAAARPACGTTCDCTTNPLQSTPMVWGMGADCSAAFNDGLAQSRALQSCADGVCFEEVIIDAPCAWHEPSQEYMIDLHTNYRCYFCTSAACPSPEPQEPAPQEPQEF